MSYSYDAKFQFISQKFLYVTLCELYMASANRTGLN